MNLILQPPNNWNLEVAFSSLFLLNFSQCAYMATVTWWPHRHVVIILLHLIYEICYIDIWCVVIVVKLRH